MHLRGAGNSMMKAVFTSRLGQQTFSYFMAQLANAAIGLAVLAVLTRSLSLTDFGAYSFVLTLITFVGLFFDFGMSPSGARLMALAQNPEEQRSRAGVLLAGAGVLGLGLSIVLAFGSLFIDALFGQNLSALLLLAAPFALVLPVQESVLLLCQGSNRIGLLSVVTVLPRVLLLPALLIIASSGGMRTSHAIAATLAATVVAVALAVALLRPRMHAFRANARLLRTEMREFGRQTYAGRLVDSLTTGVDRMLLSKFHGLAPVGLYSIAFTMATPISMLSRSLASSAYHRFANEDAIPRRMLVMNAAWCVAGAAALVASGALIITVFFSRNYLPSLSVLPFLACGAALVGLNSLFHSFFMARREGRVIRIMAFATSGANVILNIALVPVLSMAGAGIAFVSSNALNLVLNVLYYKRYRMRVAQAPSSTEPRLHEDGTENFSRYTEC